MRVTVILFVLAIRSVVTKGGAGLPEPPPLRRGCALAVSPISTVETGLFLVCGSEKFRLYHPKNLYGNVRIANRDEALHFARLFTSRRTFFLVNLDGRVELCASRCPASDTVLIRQPPEWFFDARVDESNDPIEGKIFYIERHVVGLDQSIRRVRERISEYGNYDLRSETVMATDAAQFGIVHIGDH